MRFFQVKPAIYYGEGALKEIENYNFKKVCIVTDQGMVKFGLLKMLTDLLDEKGIDYHVFADVESDPSTDIVEKGLMHIIMNKPDALIAIGGGSVIDAAKAIIYYCVNFKRIIFEDEYVHKPTFIAIPTTAGTGSEVTEYAVITDKKNNTKIPLTDILMMPDAAILDSKLLESVPAGSTAATGMDVMTHAIESFISTGNNPFARCYANKAVELVFRSLHCSYADGHDLEAKSSMQIASCMAGIAFNSAGLGITHSIAHAIGASFHLPHGLANAIALPYVIKFNGADDKVQHQYARLLSGSGILNISGDATGTLYNSVVSLNNSLNIPTSYKVFGIAEEDYLKARDEMLGKAMADVCTSTNPVEVTRASLQMVMDQTYYGF
ncbi:iron-containing alcohol dehydrogenase [Acetobacterium paludosum]|uniref:Iron-containing alcohol dehydrogenase n=1 Tax=Acetobacterium paludosum TaxID=52693 RepID=A0A923HUL7_9FIRM|nr:1-propanol dehydrogenase PduQ [Acetobacterium paludosum]MBC3888002.1 iron-containing alcohol dehydrogenase [Acetobacterium paludosum]